MKKDIISVMMHPIRIKILQELRLKGSATTKEIQAACGNVAQSTLYRHLKELLNADLIKVVDENMVNGIIEKVYGPGRSINQEVKKDPGKRTGDEYLQMFTQYMIAILADFKNYIDHHPDTSKILDNIGFSSASMFLSCEEGEAMMNEIKEILVKRMNNEPKEGRQLMKFSMININTTDG